MREGEGGDEHGGGRERQEVVNVEIFKAQKITYLFGCVEQNGSGVVQSTVMLVIGQPILEREREKTICVQVHQHSNKATTIHVLHSFVNSRFCDSQTSTLQLQNCSWPTISD